MYCNQKVDFHAHYLSETYYRYLKEYEGDHPDSFPTPKWSLEHHLKLMDACGTAFSFLSVSSPHMIKVDRETEIRLVHQMNIEGGELVSRAPDRVGLFASLPLPYTDAAIKEAVFSLDELKADGFGLNTNYLGVYLGNKSYDPLMEFLDSRRAVIAIHPTTPSAVPEVNEEVPTPVMEFFMDTTRTFLNMVMNDIFGRFPNIKWIIPHGGAYIPLLSDRIDSFYLMLKGKLSEDHPLDFKGDMRHVYFDSAGFVLQKQLAVLLQDVTSKNLLYGSDMPYTPDITVKGMSGGLEALNILSESDKADMFTGNAVRLFPRLGELLNVKVCGDSVCYADTPLTKTEKKMRKTRERLLFLYHRMVP